MRGKLRLPLVLTSVIVGTTAAAAATLVACDDDPEEGGIYCFDTRPDGGAGTPDATPCPTRVEDPEDCPPGCEPLG